MNLTGNTIFITGWRFRHRARLKEYESGPTASLAREIMKGFELTAAPDDVLDGAKAIVKIVDMRFGTRPFRVRIDPAQRAETDLRSPYRYTQVVSSSESCFGSSSLRWWKLLD